MAKRSGTSSSGARAFSGGGGGSGNGLAQSGGINHTFGGGKGGTKESRKSTTDRRIGGGRLNNGLEYDIRSQGGSKALVPKSFSVGKPPPLHPNSAKTQATKKVTVRRPAYGGGSK